MIQPQIGQAAPLRRQTVPPRRFSVRRSMQYVVLACLLPAAMMIAWLVNDAYHVKQQSIELSTESIAKEAMAYVERELAIKESTLKLMATSADLLRGDLRAFQRQAEDAVTTTMVLNFVLTDAAGTELVNTLVPYGGTLSSQGTPAELAAVFTEETTQLTPLFFDPVTQRPTIAMGVPVMRRGEVIHSLNIGMGPAQINRMLEKINLPDGWLIAVIDQNGRIIGRTRDADRYVGNQAVDSLWQAIQRQPSGRLRSETQEGYAVATAFSRSTQWGWSIAVGAPEKDLRMDLMRQTQWVALGILMALSIGVGLSYRLSKEVLTSLTQLNRQAQAVIEGQPVSAPDLLMEEAESVSLALHRAGGAMGEALYQANHDRLTSLGNRAYLEEEAQRMLALAQRMAIPLALVMLDLDGFKAVNDQYGHAAGDEVLREVARRILKLVRREDIVARLGGDEFCVMLNNADVSQAHTSAERLIAALSQPYEGVTTRVGASAGVALIEGQTRGLPYWLAKADAALYDAKNHGKGRVVIAPHAENPKSE
jgi:diguanylate cyclase (GGDEF)-like protein